MEMNSRRMTNAEMIEIYFFLSERRIMKQQWGQHVDFDDVLWWVTEPDPTFKAVSLLLENKWS